jgi:hypothetical protein
MDTIYQESVTSYALHHSIPRKFRKVVFLILPALANEKMRAQEFRKYGPN